MHAQLRDQLLGAVQDRRAGEREPQRVVGEPLGQLERRLRPRRARVLQVVRLVQNERARLQLGQRVGVPVEDVVVEDDDLRLAGLVRPGGFRAAAQHRDAAVRQPVLRLALPDELHARRAHHDGREGVVRLDRGERLYRLAEALLVGDEGAAPLERVADSGALEGVELAAERQADELGVVGVRQRHGVGRPLVLLRELLEQLGGRLLDVHLGMRLQELG